MQCEQRRDGGKLEDIERDRQERSANTKKAQRVRSRKRIEANPQRNGTGGGVRMLRMKTKRRGNQSPDEGRRGPKQHMAAEKDKRTTWKQQPLMFAGL